MKTHFSALCLPRLPHIRHVSLYYPVSTHPFSTNRLKLMKRTSWREVITKVRIAEQNEDIS
jgi:hypothetical protein